MKKKHSPSQLLYYFITLPIVIVWMLASLPANAQNTSSAITGKVLDENGKALTGAAVTIKGSSKGTLTNNAGEFTLKDVKSGAVLVVTYQGYESANIEVKEQ